MMIRASLRGLLAYLVAWGPALAGTSDDTRISSNVVGLNMQSPGIIDAAAVILFYGNNPEKFDRISDDVVRLKDFNGKVLELRKMPNKDCAFQQFDITNGERLYGQFDFSKMRSDYETLPSRFGAVTIRFTGEGFFCWKDANVAKCWNVYDIHSGGIGETRRVLRAAAFIFDKYCSPLQPKTPF